MNNRRQTSASFVALNKFAHIYVTINIDLHENKVVREFHLVTRGYKTWISEEPSCGTPSVLMRLYSGGKPS